MMRLRVSSKGEFEKGMKWLSEASDVNTYKKRLEDIGRLGVSLLQQATPKDSGLTATSWKYQIIQNDYKMLELFFINDAHPESKVNVAFLIQVGHATRNGGYVPPVNYIHPVFSEIYKMTGKEIVRRLNNETD